MTSDLDKKLEDLFDKTKISENEFYTVPSSPLLCKGTSISAKILSALHSIPYGKRTASYLKPLQIKNNETLDKSLAYTFITPQVNSKKPKLQETGFQQTLLLSDSPLVTALKRKLSPKSTHHLYSYSLKRPKVHIKTENQEIKESSTVKVRFN
mmetsp:Transcript_10677/g.15977  ORF Transcript_10677/g.15977 Transcript_10677/m.15977 type:complete len:153 (-) Transcript_10677:2061-2519(-)